MRKFIFSVLAAFAVFATGAIPASALGQQDADVFVQPVEPLDAQPVDPVPVEPEPIAQLPIGALHLRGDVFANGVPIGLIDFGLFWNEDDPSEAQLWALLDDVPAPVCIGRIFDSPSGEPVFFGSTSLMEPAGICMMSQLPDHSGIALFAASNDGQWASSILRNPNRAEPVPIFE